MSKKNLLFIFAVLIGFIFTACGNSAGGDSLVNNGQNDGGYKPPEPIGTLTITGLNDFNGNYISGTTFYISVGGYEIYTDEYGRYLRADDDWEIIFQDANTTSISYLN